ncbi:MAG: hypothetical protein WBD74_00455 [Candidatus Aquilonibacter sp.]
MLGVVLALAVQHCAFSGPATHLIGSCGHMFDQDPKMMLASRTNVIDGVWRRDADPSAVWAGTMSDADDPHAPIELETYGGAGILRTVYGWFYASNIRTSAQGLTFDVDSAHEVLPNDLDREIVRRSAAMLSSTNVWNRKDNRKCAQGATSWSIYCAMEAATAEVTGGMDHRRPAMEVVREIVDDRTAGRGYNHRLMNYNNDPATTLADVASLFREALERMNDAVWLQAHGFATSTDVFDIART